MPINRIATSTFHNQNLRDMARVQTSLAELNRQISSGLKANTFADLNGVVERISSYTAKLSGIETFLKNNNSIESRLNVMDQSVTQIQDAAEDFASLIALRRNPASANGLNFKPQAEALLANITQSLNISIEGRYLFAGSKTDVQPVKTPHTELLETGVADDTYYQGDGQSIGARISDSLQINYGVPANDPAFQNLIGAIKTALESDGENSDEGFATAVDMLNSAISGLANIRAGIGSNINTVNAVNEQHEQLKVYWNQAVSEDTSTDIAEASIKLASDQTVLQATFQAFASLSRLRLTDFLN